MPKCRLCREAEATIYDRAWPLCARCDFIIERVNEHVLHSTEELPSDFVRKSGAMYDQIHGDRSGTQKHP